MKHQLIKIKTKNQKRVGRGYGSGKGGHTSGRGQKGQKTRRSIGVLFEGMKMKKSFIKRLPLSRGKGKFKARVKPLVLNLEALNIFSNGENVDINTLTEKDLVDEKQVKLRGIKILGDGKLVKKLKVAVKTSASAAKKIIAAGGSVV